MKSETSIKLFELSQEFIPDKKKAGLFVQKIEETIDNKMELRHENLATKTDLADLKVELVEIISDQKAELKGDIAALRSDLTKSIYFMGLVQFLAIMGGVLAIVTLMLKIVSYKLVCKRQASRQWQIRALQVMNDVYILKWC